MDVLRKINAGLLAAVLALTGTAVNLTDNDLTAKAAAAIVYNANELPTFAERTVQDVADAYSEALYAGAAYENQNSDTWYVKTPVLENPYDAGVLTQDTHTAMTEITNFYRWLMGNQKLQTVSQHSDHLQAGALIRNYDYAHTVNADNKPADMSGILWDYGACCSHNILAAGFTPQGAITGWMNEGYNMENGMWDSIGHRVMMMKMTLSDIQYGFSGVVAIGDTVNHDNEAVQPFSAFPAPGYMPSDLMNPSRSAWSLELNSDIVEMYDEYEVTVTITNLDTGAVWTRMADNEMLMSSYGSVVFVQPDDYTDAGYTDSYQVVVSGLVDVATGGSAEIQYTVDFFDLAQYAKSRVLNTEFRKEYGIGPDMMNEAELEKVAAILPQTIPIQTESGLHLEVPVTGAWQVYMANSCFVNAGDVSALPGHITDHYGRLQHVTIPFAEKTGYTALYDFLDIIPRTVQAGGTVSISAYRTNVSTDTVHIFKLREAEDGGYTAIQKFDSADYADGSGTVKEGYTIEQASAKDAGTYLSVYFNQGWLNDGHTVTVFVSNSSSTLTINGLSGDVNQDGMIALGDLVSMTKVLIGDAPERLGYADVNKDGRVNVFDMVNLREQLREAV